MIIKFSKRFDKSYQKLGLKIQDKFNERLIIFENNKLDKLLNNHMLKGKYTGFKSINITGNYRAIFRENKEGNFEFTEFVDIGTHSQLYN